MIRRCLLALVLVLGLVLAAAGGAQARSEKSLAYPRDQAWAAAVRFLVVDEHVKVTDKDTEAGYVVFELKDDGKTWRGSMEVVAVEDDGRKSVLFVVQISDRPTWVEIQMLTRLERKLQVELGRPAPTSPRKKEPPVAPKEPKEPGEAKDPKPAPKDDDGPPISATP